MSGCNLPPADQLAVTSSTFCRKQRMIGVLHNMNLHTTYMFLWATAGEYSLVRGDKVFLDCCIWMLLTKIVNFPLIASIYQNLPTSQTLYKNKEEGCERNALAVLTAPLYTMALSTVVFGSRS